MADSIVITIDDIEFQLFAKRGLFWKKHETLFVADTHFGKEATFGRFGIPVPLGGTLNTLAEISDLLRTTSATRLVLLGDMFHARSSLSKDVILALDEFFAQHANIQFILVRGNHDVRVGRLPAQWPIETIDPGTMLGSCVLGHHPTEDSSRQELLLCGHLHPAIRVRSSQDSLTKVPCFWLSKRRLIFPAIGGFTGTTSVRMETDDRTWIIVEGQIIEHRY